MKKQIFGSLALIAILVGLTAPTLAQETPILVWIDTTRQAAVDAYIAAHPENADLIEVEIVDRAEFPQKVLLFNNTGEGWPDVVFAEPEIIAAVADEQHDYPLDLTPYVSADILDGFADGANAPCMTPDGQLLCLRNDLAHAVLWYDAPLMEEFGYEVPTTWEEYTALGEQVAQEHPGYIIGAFGDDQGMSTYLWASSCPTGQLIDVSTVYINTADPTCTRAANMVDTLLANGTLAPLSPFDPAFVQLVTEGKLLMLPAASWYGEYIFGGAADSLYYQEANGRLGVAAPLRWNDAEVAWTGAQGGSSWAVSKHSTNPELAAEFVIFVTTADGYQGTAPTFPAYQPAATVWSQTLATNGVYATDPFPVLEESAPLIDPLWGNVRYSRAGAFNTVVIAGLQDGQTVAELMPAFQEQLANLAQTAGYTVVTSR
ncbi:MAG: extracellular solute-binding protein [Chloroflexota bacterium]|nr:extracellular solute-binding protein [Chloroflexota bacterium]